MHPVSRSELETVLDIAEQAYPEHAFDRAKAREWAINAIGNPDIAFWRLGDAVVIAALAQAFWGGPRKCYLLYAFGAPSPKRIWDVMKLLRAGEEWRKRQGAESFHFGEDTGIDFAPLAKRLGAKLDRPNWKLEGGHSQPAEPARWSPTLLSALSSGRRSALEQVLRS